MKSEWSHPINEIKVSIAFFAKKSEKFPIGADTTSLRITTDKRKDQIYIIRLFNLKDKRSLVKYFFFDKETTGFFIDVKGFGYYQIERSSRGLKVVLKSTELK